jgi:hypothetical protein
MIIGSKDMVKGILSFPVKMLVRNSGSISVSFIWTCPFTAWRHIKNPRNTSNNAKIYPWICENNLMIPFFAILCL